jgi:hypothetical protein
MRWRMTNVLQLQLLSAWITDTLLQFCPWQVPLLRQTLSLDGPPQWAGAVLDLVQNALIHGELALGMYGECGGLVVAHRRGANQDRPARQRDDALD